MQVARMTYEQTRVLYHTARARAWKELGYDDMESIHLAIADKWQALHDEWQAVLNSRKVGN